MDALNDCQRKSDTCPGTPIDVLEQDILDASPFLLDLLLQDKTTEKNIVWATDDYVANGSAYAPEKEILPALITGANTKIIQPRIAKNKEAQRNRTRKSAEVFTPGWICNLMNDLCDEEWFGRENVFNTLNGHDWTPTKQAIAFEPDGRKTPPWMRYVDSRRLEITCGEAPYLVSRYDATTGEPLPIEKRIGVLDRKLRIVSENTANETDWFFWARRAFESTYGYEYQGDNLLLARENLLCTFADYHVAKFGKPAPLTQLKQIANIIAWNVWQMDGLKDCVPFCTEQSPQLDLFADTASFSKQTACLIKDWRSKKILKFKELKGINTMKFDFCVGNPPYQDERQGESNTTLPVYNYFMEAAYSISQRVAFITPARFLFDAGRTPSDWNEKMLNDKNFKVIKYEADSFKIFGNNVEIKGGIIISYRDSNKVFGEIGVFIPHIELKSLLKKVKFINKNEQWLSSIIYVANKFNIEILEKDYPIYSNRERRLSSNVLSFQCFHNEKEDNDVSIYGVINNKRNLKYIKKKYIDDINTNINGYKVVLPKADGNGSFGETLTKPEVLNITSGYTHTFYGIGNFKSIEEAKNLSKYIKTKFSRALLGIVKVTQDVNASKWKYVPLQDFTDKSDIDWSKSVREIDQQLYAKYGLSDDEIAFIEKNVKEMA